MSNTTRNLRSSNRSNDGDPSDSTHQQPQPAAGPSRSVPADLPSGSVPSSFSGTFTPPYPPSGHRLKTNVLKYDGKISLSSFLYKLEVEAEAQLVLGDDAKMGLLLRGSFDGPVQEWAQSLKEAGQLPMGYESLSNLMKKVFQRQGTVSAARGKLKALRQLGPGDSHNFKFNTLLAQSGFKDSEEVRDRYVQGLSVQARKELINPLIPLPSNLPELQEAAALAIEKARSEYFREHGKPIFWIHPEEGGRHKRPNSDQESNKPRKALRIEGIQKRKEQEKKGTQACYACQKPGHRFKDCRWLMKMRKEHASKETDF